MRRSSACALLVLCACGRLDFDPRGDAAPPGPCMLGITGSAARVNINTHVAFTATAGTPPYAYSTTGPGEIDPSTGVYDGAPRPATVQVTVADAAGCTATGVVDVVAGDTLYFIAGTGGGGVPTTGVYSSTDGASWNLIGNVPSARYAGTALVFDNKLWLLGGADVGDIDDVLSSPDGVTWTLAGHLPLPDSYLSAVVYAGKMWVVGGMGLPGEVYSSTDGATWTMVGTLGFNAHGGAMASFAGEMWYVGGHDNVVFYQEARSTTDGATWTTIGTLPSGREYMGLVVTDSAMTITGGTGSTIFSDVDSSSDGAVWTSAAVLPGPRSEGAIAPLGANYFYAGGTDGGAVWSSPDGITFTPVAGSTFPVPRVDGYMAAFSVTP